MRLDTRHGVTQYIAIRYTHAGDVHGDRLEVDCAEDVYVYITRGAVEIRQDIDGKPVIMQRFRLEEDEG